MGPQMADDDLAGLVDIPAVMRLDRGDDAGRNGKQKCGDERREELVHHYSPTRTPALVDQGCFTSAGLLALGSKPDVRLPGAGKRQWHQDGLADHSCGSSTGFTPVSLCKP